MFTKTKDFKTPKFALLIVLIALAVIFSTAAEEKVNAAGSDIESIKYEPAKSEVVYSTADTYLEADDLEDEVKNDDEYNVDARLMNHFNPTCAAVDSAFLELFSFDDFEDCTSMSGNFLISTTDKLIITRKDGSVQTLSPRYVRFYWYKGGGSGGAGFNIAWFDENNKKTDVVTDFSWSNKPKAYTDSRFLKKVYKSGTYDNTVTVKVGNKSTTFKKTIVIKGKALSSYDKTVPVLSNKDVKTGIRKTKGTIIDGFWIKWPWHKGDHSYAVKLKQFFPKSNKSSKYETFNQVFNTETSVVETSSSMLENDYGSNFTEWRDLTTDTMMEISVSIIKKANPKKAGSSYVYGKYSKPVRVFLSKNKTLKAKGKMKSVRLTWSKVKRASGYKIKYSTRKNMSKAKTIKVKGGNKKAYTVKKLKKNKKYYFQITPYKVYKGKTYTGYTSAKRAARAK